MPVELTGYRVFIASPAGLEKERLTFRRTLTSYNESDALARKILFVPVGWEETLEGLGRPQELINQDVKTCDFFVLVLWDRWGTPPQVDPIPYTSGTEEEFKIALECQSQPYHPMREVLVFFKSVDIQRMSDPGPQLTRVLEFKKQLEHDKNLLFSTFDDQAAFEQRLRCHLADWVRKHENAKTAPGALSTTVPEVELEPHLSLPLPPASSHLRLADELAKKGERIAAEMAFARANASGIDAEALYRYGKFLMEEGRLTDAERAFDRIVREAPETNWTVLALHELGLLSRERKDLDNAEAMIRRSLELAEKMQDEKFVGRNLQVLGSLEYYRYREASARRLYRKALEIAGRTKDEELVGRVFYNLSLLAKGSKGQSRYRAKALAIAQQHQFTDLWSLILCAIAEDEIDESKATSAAEQAVNAVSSGSLTQLAYAQCVAGEVYSKYRRWPKASSSLQASCALSTKLGLTRLFERADASLRRLRARKRRQNFTRVSAKGSKKLGAKLGPRPKQRGRKSRS